jgi:hypothetical protein
LVLALKEGIGNYEVLRLRTGLGYSSRGFGFVGAIEDEGGTPASGHILIIYRFRKGRIEIYSLLSQEEENQNIRAGLTQC